MVEKIAGAVCLAVILAAVGWVAHADAECSARGGVLVRAVVGLPECVKAR